MEIRDKRVMVLGGWGLVGTAVCRQLLLEEPKELIVLSLQEHEAREACDVLQPDAADRTLLIPYWGNVFVRDSMQGLSRSEILGNDKYRNRLIEDTMEDLSEELLEHSHLYQTIWRFKPDILIDCINSATAVAYQDVFSGYHNLKGELKRHKQSKAYSETLVSEVEKILCTLYIPQLIRHVQILYEAMRRSRTGFFVKIGTSGTGGMGLNIPYTHSEEKPSRTLLSKSTVAGAHSLLLFLMARTPDAPITKEIKPTAAIAWKKIAYGEIKKNGRPVELYDCPPSQAVKLKGRLRLSGDHGRRVEGRTLKSVFVDTGENGTFSYGEFSAISSSGQMGLVTPEEIARSVIFEIRGGNTGHDVINALDNATMGPTYRAGVMRESALAKMQALMAEHQCDSVAFELLGPPRLSKLLYEAHILKRAFVKMQAIAETPAEELSQKVQALIFSDEMLRSSILSIGIPILLRDGKQLLRGPAIKIPAYRGSDELEISPVAIDAWARDGWVDLRESNMEKWRERLHLIFDETDRIPVDDTSSQFDRDRSFWFDEPSLNIGKVVGWIFSNEEHGLRMKD